MSSLAVPAANFSLTAFHAKYFANALTLRGGEGAERLGAALTSASVDLNPHQVSAALFALNSPLPQGALLADEVGLGKTIEAGLVLCQLWAERKRRFIVVCPAALRKQWQNELWEKFNLPAEILDAKRVRELQKSGGGNGFACEKIIILSYNFAAKNRDILRTIQFDCCVFDEAHKLRNSHRLGNRIGQALRFAFAGRKKILLSATPLQNNLTELYGIATLLDEDFFGDLPTFRSLYCNAGGDLKALRERLKDFCVRSLRQNVQTYVRYTSRFPLTIQFAGTRAELELYNDVSTYLQNENTYAFPQKQRKMLILLVRKLLASSPAALAGTLETILERLEKLRADFLSQKQSAFPPSDADPDWLDEILDDETIIDDFEEDEEENNDDVPADDSVPAINLKKLDAEIALVRDLCSRAREQIHSDSKTRSLLSALSQGWAKLAQLGAAQKAVIFTESRRSMEFLRTFLENNGYAGEVVCFSGGGKRAPQEEAIYNNYLAEHADEKISRGVLLRHALIEHFRSRAKILIATEAGAEGINLQFCSMVVNYDLPWNPQRVEQRIGRCHRYGQKNDVVVVNFLNTGNAADARVFELLSEKFNLFSGIFGATDEILGAIDDAGISIEKRIFEIFQKCRNADEINREFAELQKTCAAQIEQQRKQTHKDILANLDPQVIAHLKLAGDWAKTLPLREHQFWQLTKFVLREHANFDDTTLSFVLHKSPFPQISVPARFSFAKKGVPAPDAIPYRPNSDLGEWVIKMAKNAETPLAELVFDVSGNALKIPVLETLKGKSGVLSLDKLTLESLEPSDFLLFSALDENQVSLDAELSRRLFELFAQSVPATAFSPMATEKLSQNCTLSAEALAQEMAQKNESEFHEICDRLDRWSRDKLAVAERQIADAKAHLQQIRMKLPKTVEERELFERECKKARIAVDRARSERNKIEDEIQTKTDQAIAELTKKLAPTKSVQNLFKIRWRVV